MEIMSRIDHPNIVKLHRLFEDDSTYALVMELMTGGEVFDYIVDRDHLSEQEAAALIRPIIDAINYCHHLGIIHRDLKPENLLLSSKDPSKAVVKISDFGLARYLSTNSLAETSCGTIGYFAPEILGNKKYGHECDSWSIGVILYIMLCGYPPFWDDGRSTVVQKV
mmetsp:Transcript_3180/g.3083  ORF Transcript_3180/g.3083 Transcript_3180/m.3083 type:complete len:166 (-) Transcript_3180:272-769(-)